MTTREFKKLLKEIEIDYNEDYGEVAYWSGPTKQVVAVISTWRRFEFKLDEYWFNQLYFVRQEKLFDLITEYSRTRIKDREERILRVEVFEEVDIEVQSDKEEHIRAKLDELGYKNMFFNIKGWKDDIDED